MVTDYSSRWEKVSEKEEGKGLGSTGEEDWTTPVEGGGG